MAEAVAAAAAVIQFVDVAVRLSFKLNRLCSEVHNAPLRLQRLKTDLLHQIDIAQGVKEKHLSAFNGAVTSPTFDEFFLGYTALAEDLCKILDKILDRNDGGLFRKGWSGICSIRRREKITELCERLEQKRSTLSLWLCAANL